MERFAQQQERERIISLLLAEQEIVDDQLSEMLIARLINKINALPLDPPRQDEIKMPFTSESLSTLAAMKIPDSAPTDVIDELNRIKAQAAIAVQGRAG